MPLVDVVGGLLVGMCGHERSQCQSFLGARHHELEPYLGFLVQPSLLARAGLGSSSGEEGPHPLGTVGAARVVPDPSRARSGDRLEHRRRVLRGQEGDDLQDILAVMKNKRPRGAEFPAIPSREAAARSRVSSAKKT